MPGVLVRPQLLVWAFWSYTIIDNVDNISSREIYFGEMKCTSWSLHSRNVVLESVFKLTNVRKAYFHILIYHIYKQLYIYCYQRELFYMYE